MFTGVKPLVAPPAVRDGDLVAVVAPAFRLVPERFRGGLAKLSGRLRLRVADDILRTERYLAGSDARRAEELDAALRDPDVRAVLVGRGGYGIARLLPMLDPTVLRADPKPIVGFSDVTALLAWAALAGVRGIHGPVVSQLVDLPDADVDALVRALRDPAPPMPIPLAPLAAATDARGSLVVGNLTLLTNLIGTPWQLDLDGAIVVTEEIGEKPYTLDRDLTHLQQAGGLARAGAVVLGDLVRCTEPRFVDGMVDDPAPAFAAVEERLRAFAVPGYRGAPVGHGARNLALPFGARAAVHDGVLEILDGAVS
jgi:muramoyltetrapeptide carboxypeptidase